MKMFIHYSRRSKNKQCIKKQLAASKQHTQNTVTNNVSVIATAITALQGVKGQQNNNKRYKHFCNENNSKC